MTTDDWREELEGWSNSELEKFKSEHEEYWSDLDAQDEDIGHIGKFAREKYEIVIDLIEVELISRGLKQ